MNDNTDDRNVYLELMNAQLAVQLPLVFGRVRLRRARERTGGVWMVYDVAGRKARKVASIGRSLLIMAILVKVVLSGWFAVAQSHRFYTISYSTLFILYYIPRAFNVRSRLGTRIVHAVAYDAKQRHIIKHVVVTT